MSKNVTDLGISNEVMGVSVKDLLNNEVALKLLINKYNQLNNENVMLKEDLNRQSTVERALMLQQKNKKIAAFFSLIGTILISFGINFVTSIPWDIKGIILLIIGVFMELVGLYFSFKEEE